MSANNTASQGPAVTITCTIFTVLAAITVSTRLFARVVILKSPGRDELAIGISFLCSVALLVSTIYQVKYGLGKHISAVSEADFGEVLKCLWVSILFYNASLTLTKVSIILQYMRVFVGPRIRMACWIAMGLMILYGAETLLTGIFSCVPVQAFWTGDPSAHCLPKKFLWFFNAACNMLSDLIILALPMPVLSALKLPTRQRIGLMLIFALGGFVFLVSTLRLHSLYVVSISTDITWDNTDAAIWSVIEVNIGIMCASLPAIKPALSWIFPHLLSTNRSRTPGYPGTNNSRTHNTAGTAHTTSNPYIDDSPIKLHDVSLNHPKTVTKVMADRRRGEDGNVKKGVTFTYATDSENGKDIFVTTSMTQDVESKSEMGSEKDLILQR